MGSAGVVAPQAGEARAAPRARSGAASAAALRGRDPARRACATRRPARPFRSKARSKKPASSSAPSACSCAACATATRCCTCASSTSIRASRSNSRRARACALLGEVRKGFFGAEMVHPRYRVLRGDDPLPQALTPVYPTTAGLSQAMLRKLVERALDAADLADTLPPEIVAPLKLPSFSTASSICTIRRPTRASTALEERTHPAWRRIKFDELLAQQLSMRMHHRQRQSVARAAARAACASCRPSCSPRCRSSSRARSSACCARSARTSPGRIRCSACCRATSAAARPWSRRWPRCRRSKAATRWRSWRRPRSWPSSTTASSRSGWRRSASTSPGSPAALGAQGQARRSSSA